MNCRNFRELAQQRVVDLTALVDQGLARDGKVDPAVELAKWDVDVQQHVGECEHCARFWKGLFLHVELLGSLARQPVPGDLAGRVVAAQNAGYREDRAAARVAALPALAAPPVLARRVEQDFRVKAPAVLDRLVESQLEGGLDHQSSARAELAVRGVRAFAVMAVVALALWATLPRISGRSSVMAAPPLTAGLGGYRFEIVRVDSVDEASPDAEVRGFIESITGGVANAR